MPSQPHSLTTSGRVDPIGIGSTAPEFAWKLPVDAQQDAYEITVASDGSFDECDVEWRSGVVEGGQPFGVSYEGQALLSRSQYHWRVRVYEGGVPSVWSEVARFETGVVGPDRFSARWISAAAAGSDDRRALYFRTAVTLASPVVRARAYASALGWYRLFVNRDDLTGTALVPRWTPFQESVEYQVYDASASFQVGTNVIGIAVGDGRFRGALGGDAEDARYGDRLGAFAEIVLDLADGTRTTIVTDESWAVGLGRVRRADPMLAVEVDLSIDEHAWLDPQVTLEGEAAAVRLPEHSRSLLSEEVERVREIARLPGTVWRSPSGKQIVDFGQTFAGVAALTLRGHAGDRVLITYAEALTQAGEIDTDYLFARAPSRPGKEFQRDEVLLADGSTPYLPWFTIRGFRYASVEGAGDLTPDDVEGIVLSTDMPAIARFSASDQRLEQLWWNAMRSLRSNFTDTATDCPTRERSGWTGDIQVFGSTAVQLVAADNFLRRYLRNVAIEQYCDGRVPPYVPSESLPENRISFLDYASTSVGWGDVVVLLPWTLYEYLGDEQVLRAQYSSAKKWVDHLAWRARTKKGFLRRFGRRAGALERYVVDTGYHWGEWLRAGEEHINTWWKHKRRPPAEVATAYFAHSSTVLSRIAEVVGNEADAAHYLDLGQKAARAWRAAFVRRGGARIGNDKQDDYVRGLAFDLLLPKQRAAAVNRLVELIEASGDHLGTGFLSTGMLLPTLVEAGRSDVAYRLLFQTTAPSWLAQVQQGATSIWERWRGYDDDGNAQDSHNHYAFGSVVRFLHEHAAGMSPAAPGYREIRFAPVITDHLDSAGVSIETPFGTAASSWRRSHEGVRLQVTVPPGASGIVHFMGEVQPVGPGSHTFTAQAASASAGPGTTTGLQL